MRAAAMAEEILVIVLFLACAEPSVLEAPLCV
jgi:hypothetical protein